MLSEGAPGGIPEKSPGVRAATLEEQLRFAAPYISASLERSPCGHSLEQVLGEVVANRARLWLGTDSAAVSQFVATERIWHAGGDMPDLIRTIQAAWPVMQRAGIERLAIENTRKGWEKILKPHGFGSMRALIKEA